MLILASSSPRRRELLQMARIPFVPEPAEIDETRLPGEAASPFTLRLAREKALAVAAAHPCDYVLGADTVVVAPFSEILGKPAHHKDAKRMLRLLAGGTHQVVTGLCLIQPSSIDPGAVSQVETLDRRWQASAVTTQVTMGEISEAEIDAYIATGEPMDKAGAYAIQGMASRWITEIEGCYYSVVGLPLPLVYRWLRTEGLL